MSALVVRIVQRRLVTVTHFHEAPLACSRIGVAIDVQSTGLDRETDRTIELAVQRFRFDDRGQIVQVGLPWVWREDHGIPIDPKITQFTGFAVDDVSGQATDEEMAVEILSSADIIIAHNAAFDRPFVDRRLPAIARKPWTFDGRAGLA
jgi:DNA polymerase III subunit epsilon